MKCQASFLRKIPPKIKMSSAVVVISILRDNCSQTESLTFSRQMVLMKCEALFSLKKKKKKKERQIKMSSAPVAIK